MNGIILTQNSTFIIGWVAKILGYIMEGIFNLIDIIGIPNIGLAIILFTIVVNLLMLPLTYKQQKFSKLSAKMNPEIQAIQAKYKGKKDQNSQMAMSQETQAVYAKYGVSPTGSCVYMLIQMPILFALYRVIYSMPAYVTKIGDTFRVLADKIMQVDDGTYSFLTDSDANANIAKVVTQYGQSLTKGIEAGNASSIQNGIVDILNKVSSSDLAAISDHYGLGSLTYNGELILSNGTTRGLIDTYNNFFGLNIGNSPSYIVSNAIKAGAIGLVIGAIMIPILSAVTQWINVKLMPQQESNPNAQGNDQAAAMQQSMKTMNMFMPIMSAFFCYTLPCGMGVYWIAGSVIRSIQQVIINKRIDKMDIEDIILKNADKSAKKVEKMKEQAERMNAYANVNTRNIQSKANNHSYVNKDATNDSTDSSTVRKNAKPGSMMSKANLVSDFNERNNKKN